MKSHSQKFIQQRKFILVLPLIAMPLLTMIFWALGGGQGTAAHTMEEGKAGLNLELPDAQFSNDKNSWDKMSLYQKAQRDSARYNEARRTDPYVKLPLIRIDNDTIPKHGDVNVSLGKRDHSIDANEERVNKKLTELYKSLEPSVKDERLPRYDSKLPVSDYQLGNDVDKLEGMMKMMQSGSGNDPEMQEIQNVLDKILDIQHPQRVTEKIREESSKNPDKVYSVTKAQDNRIGLLSSVSHDSSEIFYEPSESNGFYGISETAAKNEEPSAIEAVIHNEQSLVSGATVKLRLLQEIYVNGQLVPVGHFVYGVCKLNGERLSIDVNAIQFEKHVLPVSLKVHDIDGIEGIYVPGAIARDVAKQSSNQALQDIQLNSMTPSLEIQAASAGVETVKNLVSKKSRLIKVFVKAGYKILLVDSKNK